MYEFLAVNQVWLASFFIAMLVLVGIWIFKKKNPNMFLSLKDISVKLFEFVEKQIPDDTPNEKLQVVDNVFKRLINELKKDPSLMEKNSILELMKEYVVQEINGENKKKL